MTPYSNCKIPGLEHAGEAELAMKLSSVCRCFLSLSEAGGLRQRVSSTRPTTRSTISDQKLREEERYQKSGALSSARILARETRSGRKNEDGSTSCATKDRVRGFGSFQSGSEIFFFLFAIVIGAVLRGLGAGSSSKNEWRVSAMVCIFWNVVFSREKGLVLGWSAEAFFVLAFSEA